MNTSNWPVISHNSIWLISRMIKQTMQERFRLQRSTKHERNSKNNNDLLAWACVYVSRAFLRVSDCSIDSRFLSQLNRQISSGRFNEIITVHVYRIFDSLLIERRGTRCRLYEVGERANRYYLSLASVTADYCANLKGGESNFRLLRARTE